MKSFDCPQLASDLHSANEMLARFTDEINSASFKSDFVPIRDLEQKLEEALDSLESRLVISLAEAYELMKGRLIGPEDIKEAFGFTPENIPEIPFDRETLELHGRLGHYLIYEATKTKEGKPLTFIEMAKLAGSNIITKSDGTTSNRLYKDQFNDDGSAKKSAWFAEPKFASVRNETPDGGWKFVSLDVTKGSTDKDYIDQTDILVTYLKEKIFKNDLSQIPKIYTDAISKWNNDRSNLFKLVNPKTYVEACTELSNQPITQLLRESFASTVYRLIILQKTKDIKILPKIYTWSKSIVNGVFFRFGDFATSGADLNCDYPGKHFDSIGSVFCRRA